MKGNVLVTGGAGYIGSHTCAELLENGYGVVVVDNYSNSSAESVKRVEKITGKKVSLDAADVRDKAALDKIFTEKRIDWVLKQNKLTFQEIVRECKGAYPIDVLRVLRSTKYLKTAEQVFAHTHLEESNEKELVT